MANVSFYGFDGTSLFDLWSKQIEKQANRHHDGINSYVKGWGNSTRREFLASQNKIDDRCDRLERKIDGIGGTLENNIVDLETNIESKLDDVELGVVNRVTEMENKMGQRTHSLENRFKQLERLERKMDCHFQCTRALSHNTLCTQGWQLVKPVCRLNSEGRRIPSTHLPYTVRDFWKLKDPSQSESSLGGPSS